MRAARMLRWARRRAGLTQRQLAEKTGVPQSTIGRIESGATDPRLSTLRRLLRACGFDLEVEQVLGYGVDRSQIRECLDFPPERRIPRASQESRVFAMLGNARRKRVQVSA
jgi:transcriptional regulator with XRE-family HTH domain